MIRKNSNATQNDNPLSLRREFLVSLKLLFDISLLFEKFSHQNLGQIIS